MSNLDTATSGNLGLAHGGPTSDFCKDVALLLHSDNRDGAARLILERLNQPTAIKNAEERELILTSFLQYLLDGQRYIDAATLLWTPNLFSGEPRSVKLVWDSIFKNVATAVPGGSSMGKSYNIGVWCYLDWRRDPYYTSIQIVGPSEGHLEKNLFSHIAKLHTNASIKGPGELIQLGLTLDTVQRDSGIFGVVVPTGKKAAGKLQGAKAVVRSTRHPQLGPLGRIRIFLEEAENIPVGIWDDIANTMSNARGIETFKVFAAWNPKNRNAPPGQRAEPVDGWGSISIDESEVWMSKRGWSVVRLDPYKSENITQGTEVFVGLQTKEGLARTTQESGGERTKNWYTFARGWYPEDGVEMAIVPQHLMNEVVGEYEFIDTPRNLAAVDVALEGGDNAIFIMGRLGRARGWRKPNSREFFSFTDKFGQVTTREVLQVDQVFTLAKGPTDKMVEEIIRLCQGAYVRGDGLGVDRAGMPGVHDMLVSRFHSQVLGINGSNSATERKILEEDQKLPVDEYRDLLAELWFGAAKFIEFGFLKMHPRIPQDPLWSELTGRWQNLGGKKTSVETKRTYKSRGNKSPDRADALTILVFVARRLMDGIPSATGDSQRDHEAFYGEEKQRISVTDSNEDMHL